MWTGLVSDFETLDPNSDFVLDKTEIDTAAPTQEDSDEFFETYDYNGDDLVTIDEICYFIDGLLTDLDSTDYRTSLQAETTTDATPADNTTTDSSSLTDVTVATQTV